MSPRLLMATPLDPRFGVFITTTPPLELEVPLGFRPYRINATLGGSTARLGVEET